MKIYLDKRVLSVGVLGISSGLPWVMVSSSLTYWLKESGVSRADIGYAALIFSVYAINFIWSPLVNQLKIRFFPNQGQQKSWILLCQALLVFGCIIISLSDPSSHPKLTVLAALFIALFSATQDIAIDSYRVCSFDSHDSARISAAAGTATAGWWAGYAGIGFFPLILSDNGWAWPPLYLALGAFTLTLFVTTLFLPSPKTEPLSKQSDEYHHNLGISVSAKGLHKIMLSSLILFAFIVGIWVGLGSPMLSQSVSQHSAYLPTIILGMLGYCGLIGFLFAKLHTSTQKTKLNYSVPPSYMDITFAWVLTSTISPIKDFFSRNGTQLALAILSFILLFKIGEAFLGRMSLVFYQEIGYSKTDVALFSKLFTLILTIFIALSAGLINAKLGLVKGLLISGCAMAGTNLLFSLIAILGPDLKLYAITVLFDSLAAAWSSVAFVSLISALCNHAFSATQYALLASLSNLGRTTLSSISGQLVDWLNGNWALFFVLTAIMVIPSFIILWRIRHGIYALEHKNI